MKLKDGRMRVIIENIYPEIDNGRFAAKRVAGDIVSVEADIFTDGHDALSARLIYRHESESAWSVAPMKPQVNDRWRGEFAATQLGRYYFTVMGWVDHFKSWARDLEKRVAAGQDITVDREIGARMLDEAGARVEGRDAEAIRTAAAQLRNPSRDALSVATPGMVRLMERHADRQFATTYPRVLPIVVDPLLARFSAWYELFPRSLGAAEGRHGTFRDVIKHLQYVSSMGFNILYLPPIHPVGTTFRKGMNNTLPAEPGDIGSPWAIGSVEGGHKSVNPELGTIEDFRDLVRIARDEHGLELALDIAFQCSPDHPYVTEHPEWFRQRPDGTIQYAENPPKRYQDIYPFDFETLAWRELWEELKSIFEFWIEQGVHVFRVDNPHTKALGFWEWCIEDIKGRYPETIFLSEAFTRPKLMYRLAKLGFTQSYTYFTWRNMTWDLTEYLTELTQTEVSEYFRPNFWPNTPDILTEFMRTGGRPAFIQRLVLAATLSSNYGIYGPAFELGESRGLMPGSEEYWESEKYQIRDWDLDNADSLKTIITLINQARRDHPALQTNDRLRFHQTNNEQLLAYSKRTVDNRDVMLMVVNLDPLNTQAGWLEFPADEFGIEPDQPYQVQDLLGGGRYVWRDRWNYVELNPYALPAHVFRVRRRLRSEHDFDYFD
jgi:starch synthase (maltosyl-transferring)